MDSGGGPRGGPGLPRHTFTDDPFFHSTFPQESDVFNDFGPNPARHRFGGSNPRIFEDDFFDNFANGGSGFGNEPSFFRSSLPRRQPPGAGSFPSERPVSMQRQATTPQQQRSPSQQRKSPIPAEYHSHVPNGQPGGPPIHHQRQSSSNSHYGGGGGMNHPMSHQPYQPQPGYVNNNSNMGGGVGQVHVIPVQHHQSQPQPHSPIPKNIVEINNADPNSYTNGQLNPDKRRRFSHHSPQRDQSHPNSIPTVKVEDYSTREEEVDDVDFPPAISEQAIPLPPPPSCSQSPQEVEKKEEHGRSNNVPEPLVREVKVMPCDATPMKKKLAQNFVPLAGCTEQLISLLDDTERRVEQLREAASQLEQEKEQVLDILTNVKLSADFLKLEQSRVKQQDFSGEDDELNLTAERILKRCRAVDVVVNTPRNEDQTRALDEVNMLIQSVVTKMQDDLEATKEAVQRFLNACSPDEPNGPIDQRFQTKIVACTADDQKKIRRKLAQIISQIERAERVCQTPA